MYLDANKSKTAGKVDCRWTATSSGEGKYKEIRMFFME